MISSCVCFHCLHVDEDDFTELRGSVVFPAGFGSPQGQRRNCISVNITDDELHEVTEVFTLSSAHQGQSRVLVQPNITHIIIHNNDSKKLQIT